jgi:hypothetical protein
MANPVVHFEVIGKDAQALQRFYKDAFDWQMEPVMPTYAMVKAGGGRGIEGGIGSGQDANASYVSFYVEVENVDTALSKIESLGGKKIMDPMDVPNGPRIAMFTDPEGHMIGLVQASSRRA